MAGVVGVITKRPRERAEAELVRMLLAIRHESFYATGSWSDESLGVYVGWTALQQSFAESMPVHNEKGDIALIFSGEEYSALDSRQELHKRGHTFDNNGPSYLVHLYEDDAQFPASLNGRFHGIVIDRTCRAATLFNDRYGMHRLYYYETKDAFYFATEAKGIVALGPELRRVNARSLGELVACGCVLENRSLFEDINVLPPGSAWVFRNSAIERRTSYFLPTEWENQNSLSAADYHEELRDVFSRKLPAYFNGQQRIGMSLTGGLDTRMIMAWQNLVPGSLPCYTFGGMFRDCQDVLIARKVASECRQPHAVIGIGNDFLSKFAHYAERAVYLGDGCAGVHHSADLYANERAREIAPVRMTGNYGDEVLRHIRVFKPVDPVQGLFCPEFLLYVGLANVTYTGVLEVHPLSFAAFRQAPWHHHGLLALEETQLSVRTPYLDNDVVRTAFRAPKCVTTNNDLRVQLIKNGNPALRRIRTDLGFGGNSSRLSAFAAREFQKFTFKSEYAYDYGMPQVMVRFDRLLSAFHLERLFLGRHKFCHFRLWYRDTLSQYLRDMLLDSRTLSRPYLNRHTVETIVDAHVEGRRNYTTAIHKLLTLELLHRLFFDAD